MKKLFSLLLATTATIVAMAHGEDRTMLKLRLSNRTPIAVNVDGRYIDRQTTTLTLDGMRPGEHRIEVYSTGGYHARPMRIYTGTIRLEPGTVNIAMVDVYRRSLRMRIRPMDSEKDRIYAEGGKEKHDNRSDADYDEQDGAYNPDRNRSDNRDDVYGDSNNDRNRDDNNDRGVAEGYGSFPHGRNSAGANSTANMFTQRDMDDLHARIGKRITDIDKESLLKTALENRSLYTDQVREMLRWLTFESTRLDFAKWAYGRVADRQNYWKLEDAFDFSSSKKEFNDVIRGR